MKCGNCGAEMAPTDKFCAVCGHKPETEEQQAKAQTGAGQPEEKVAEVQAGVGQPEEKTAEAQAGVGQPEEKAAETQAGVGQPEEKTAETTQQTGTPDDAARPYAAPDVAEQQAQMPKSKKKKTKRVIGITAACVVAVALVSIIGVKAYQAVKKAMMSPTEYYQYVETKNRDAYKKSYTGYYDTMRGVLTEDKINQEINAKVTLSDTAKSLISLSGVDCSKFNDAEINVLENKNGSANSAQMQLKVNNENLVTFKLYFDYKNKEMYYQIPEWSESYMNVSNALNQSLRDTDYLPVDVLENPFQYLPETSDLDQIFTRYTDLAIKSAKDVEKEDVTLEAKDISQEVAAYTVKYSGSDVVEVTRDVLDEVKEDENIKHIIQKISPKLYSEYEKVMEEELAEGEAQGLKEFEQEAGKENILTMKTYVDSDDEIVGRELKVNAGGEVFEIKSICPRDGKKFGYEFTCSLGYVTYVTILGSGEEKSDVVNGEYYLSLNDSIASDMDIASGKDLLKLQLKDYDLSDIEDGEFSGTCTISSDAIPQIANYALKIQSEGGMKASKSRISVLAGKDELIGIAMENSEGSSLNSTKPSNSDTVYDITNEEDLKAYQSEISLDTWLQQVQKKIGIDLSSILSGLNGDSYDTGYDNDSSDYSEESYTY